MTGVPLLLALAGRVAAFCGADIRSANVTRGSIVNPEPIQCLTGGTEGGLGDSGDMLGANAIGLRVWTCNHLTSARNQLMSRCFNETDPFLYFRNRRVFSDGWALLSETGPTWVLYLPFKGGVSTPHEVEWRYRQEVETPWLTPYFYLRQTFTPYSLTYWQTGLKRALDAPYDLHVQPFAHLDWGDESLFAFKYGESLGRFSGGVSAADVGVRIDRWLGAGFSIWAQVEGYWIVNRDVRRANRDRASVTSRNEIAVFSLGVEFRL